MRRLPSAAGRRPRPSPALMTFGGFTLMEVLVVIAIIAILASILLPVFASVKESGRHTKCVSNLRQIHSAVIAYATDYKDAMPFETKLAESRPDFGTHIYLQPYIKNLDIFHCPSDSGDGYNSTPVWQRFGRSYKLEGRVLSNPYDQKLGMPVIRHLSALENGIDEKKTLEGKPQDRYQPPTRLQLARDEFFPWEAGKIRKEEGMQVKPMHPRGANVVFFDGHARFAKSKEEWEALR